MNKRIIIATVTTVVITSLLSIFDMRADDKSTIINHITEIKGNSVAQPTKLTSKLVAKDRPDDDKVDKDTFEAEDEDAKAGQDNKEAKETRYVNGKIVGYRVQIYSDGNQRTAKAQAQNKAKSVNAKFPHYRSYISYSAPYWRLRVGDFKGRNEAEEAAKQIRAAFPALKHEVRVVRDRINVRE